VFRGRLLAELSRAALDPAEVGRAVLTELRDATTASD
jgi:hypothetical protein